jgi:hypothetical protein
MKISIKFEPRDIWIGVFWDRSYELNNSPVGLYTQYYLDIYICIIPLLPIKIRSKIGKSFYSQYLQTEKPGIIEYKE